jgi:hypothetical protein
MPKPLSLQPMLARTGRRLQLPGQCSRRCKHKPYPSFVGAFGRRITLTGYFARFTPCRTTEFNTSMNNPEIKALKAHSAKAITAAPSNASSAAGEETPVERPDGVHVPPIQKVVKQETRPVAAPEASKGSVAPVPDAGRAAVEERDDIIPPSLASALPKNDAWGKIPAQPALTKVVKSKPASHISPDGRGGQMEVCPPHFRCP